MTLEEQLLRELKSAIFYIETYGGDVTKSFAAGGNLAQVKAIIARAENMQPRIKKNPISTGVRIVHNKLLGGWYIVRGPRQTPLGGRFDSKAEAQNHLDRQQSERDARVPSYRRVGYGVNPKARRAQAKIRKAPKAAAKCRVQMSIQKTAKTRQWVTVAEAPAKRAVAMARAVAARNPTYAVRVIAK